MKAITIATICLAGAVLISGQVATNSAGGSAGSAAAGSATGGRFCHNSCYSGPNITCQGALAAKEKILNESMVPYQVDKTACDKLNCTALIRYSFANESDHDKYQNLEKNDPTLSSIYKNAGLVSAAPEGLAKNGSCSTLGSFRRLLMNLA